MSESCNTCSDKNTCESENCDKISKLTSNDVTEVKNMIAIMSGKGGVGKSSVTGLLASNLVRKGYKVGILDADITGPSIPKMFGINKQPDIIGNYMQPPESSTGIRIISMNLLLPNEDDPVIWRGPVIAGAVKQFWTDVAWGKLDYLLVDLPPGTGDVPLTVMQSLPLTGFIIVTSPQDLTVMVVKKALNMAKLMDVEIMGMVENMSYIKCPDCNKEIKPFGEGGAKALSKETGIPILEILPIDPRLAGLCDRGLIEQYEPQLFENQMFEKTLLKQGINN